jgi:1,4-alpha-glucan branching enzyme
MKKGYLFLVLHAHLPFVRHPEHEDFLEERWFFEAITETYVPLIDLYDRLAWEGVPFRITMSVTPPLASMMADSLLQERYVRHLDKLIELSEKEIERTRSDPRFNPLAHHYHDHFLRVREIFVDRYGKNLLHAFRKHLESGSLEIITCGATHGFLPLMRTAPASVRAQVKVACNHYESVFGRRPRGIWLPECGYHPGDDEILKEAGLQYFFTDSHGILHGSPRPKYGVFAPVYCPSGVAAFGRDLESSKQVWSAHEGYPGDFWYREFYRDIGFDLDFDYIRPYIHPDGFRISTGMKYYRITGKSDWKEPYEPERARGKAEEHAANFMFNREKQAEYLFHRMGRKPVVVAPYDAELFGHWWYEGPIFLEHLIRKIARHSETLQLTTAAEYLSENPRNQPVTPSYSSWGWKGYSEVWLEGSNDWIYRHLHKASERMHEMARRYATANGTIQRTLNQMARELLLAESSDWAFMMQTRTTVEYAVQRTREHLINFLKLYHSLEQRRVDEAFLSELESRDCIFPQIDFHVYA